MKRPTLVLASVVLLWACGDATRTGPTKTVFVSEIVPACFDQVVSWACDDPLLGGVPEALADLTGDSVTVAALEARTGLSWRSLEVPSDTLYVDLEPVLGDSAWVGAWVVEPMEEGDAGDRIAVVASAAGTAVWREGERLSASRYPSRSWGPASDRYRLEVEAGDVLLHRVLRVGGGGLWRLHRVWESPDALSRQLLDATRTHAWSDLVYPRIISVEDSVVHLKPHQADLGDVPLIRFSWETLLGEPLGTAGSFVGTYPPSLPLPDRFDGTAILRTEVAVSEASAPFFVDYNAVFTDTTVARLIPALTAVPPGDDPVHEARLRAVESFFGLAGDTTPTAEWMQAQALADLYRVVHAPDGYDRFAGAQVWGYRRAWDGEVQPFWLAVPWDAAAGADTRARPLLVLLTHATGSYFEGRGVEPGWVVETAVPASVDGTFGVIPWLGGTNDIAAPLTQEIPEITAALAARFPVDTARVGYVALSHHAGELLRAMLDPDLPVAAVALGVPSVPREDLEERLDSLRTLRPDTRYIVVSADEDTDIPRALVEALEERMQEHGLVVQSVRGRHSTHRHGLLVNPAELVRRALGVPDSLTAGDTGAPVRETVSGPAETSPTGTP